MAESSDKIPGRHSDGEAARPAPFRNMTIARDTIGFEGEIVEGDEGDG